MKLNIDCIRDVLIFLEENLEINDDLEIKSQNLHTICNALEGKYEKPEIAYTLLKLKEGGYIQAQKFMGNGIISNIIVSSITYEGHQFIESIRSETVFEEVKNKLGKVGNFALDIVQKVAVNCAVSLITAGL